MIYFLFILRLRCTRRASSGRNWVDLTHGPHKAATGLQMCVLKLHSGTEGHVQTWRGGKKKAFLLQWKWAELIGISAGPSTRVQSETRCGGGRRAALGSDERACQNGRARGGSLLHSLTGQKADETCASIHQLTDSSWLREESVDKVLFVWNGIWPLHPIVQLCYRCATPARSLPSPRWRTSASPSAARSSCKVAGPVGWSCNEEDEATQHWGALCISRFKQSPSLKRCRAWGGDDVTTWNRKDQMKGSKGSQKIRE